MSLRRDAWRNMMVAGINEALDRKLFTLAPGDRWSRTSRFERSEGKIYRFAFNGILAVAYVNDAGHDELVFHVALWPTAECERWIQCSNGGRLCGEAWALGWLERRDGVWLQVSSGRPSFTCRQDRLASIAVMKAAAKGYADSGPFRI